jgi:hypothetical protein
MKKAKSPSAPKPVDNQLTLDMLLERLVDLTRIVEVQSENIRALRNVVAPLSAEPKRPALKWYEQEPQHIYWSIKVDPATLILQPGTHLRYNTDTGRVTTYDGVDIGYLNSEGTRHLCNWVKSAKLHVYLTSSRKLGIKLGRPA